MKQSEDNFKILKRYLRVYIKMATNSFAVWLTRRSAFIIFLIGKIVRYSFYFGFLIFLVKSTNGFAGYTGNQILFFTATYVLIDTLAQFLFRSVYSFRQLVVSGDLDLVLVKPINPLFRSLFGGADPVDLITLPAIIFVVVYIGSLLSPTLLHTTYYILLV